MRSGKRPRVEVVGVLVAGQDQVHAAQVAAPERRPGHPHVRPVGVLVLPRQVLREVEVDRQQAASRDLMRKPLWPSHQTLSEPGAGIVPSISSISSTP